MNTNEIIESGFFLGFIISYVDYEVQNGYVDKDQLLYVLCINEEEKKAVTLEEINKIRNNIKGMGHEDLSYAFVSSFKYPNPYLSTNKPFEWENLFYDNFIDEIESILPYTEEYQKLEEKNNKEEYDEEYYDALARFDNENIDITYVVDCESQILNQIISEIEEYKKYNYWSIDFDFYKQFIEESAPLNLLFEYCDLLVQLERLEMFHSFLEIEEEESKTNGKSQTNESSDSKEFKNNISKDELKQKNLSGFLIGENIKKPLLNFLLSDFKGKKGKDIAIMILALESNSLIAYTKRAELFNAIRVDFGNIGTDAGINKYMPDPKCMDERLKKTVDLYAEKIKKHIENLPK